MSRPLSKKEKKQRVKAWKAQQGDDLPYGHQAMLSQSEAGSHTIEEDQEPLRSTKCGFLGFVLAAPLLILAIFFSMAPFILYGLCVGLLVKAGFSASVWWKVLLIYFAPCYVAGRLDNTADRSKAFIFLADTLGLLSDIGLLIVFGISLYRATGFWFMGLLSLPVAWLMTGLCSSKRHMIEVMAKKAGVAAWGLEQDMKFEQRFRESMSSIRDEREKATKTSEANPDKQGEI